MSENTILLFREVRTDGQPHQIDIRDPHFTGSIGGNGWTTFAPEGQHNWSIAGGLATYDGTGPYIPWPLHQYLSAPLHVGVHYAVHVNLEGITAGSLDIRLGNTTVISGITSDGFYAGTLFELGPELPEWIAFWPSQDFEGSISSVLIVQDTSMSPADPEISYTEAGYLDIDEEESIGLTWEVQDVRSLSSRFGAFSKTFSLPATDGNKRLLGHLHSSNSTPYIFDPRNKTRATLLCDSIPAFRGWLSLKSIIRNGSDIRYEVELLSDQFSLIDSVKGKTVQDLNLDRYSHQLTLANMLSSHHPDRTWREGWTYPLYAMLVENAFTVADDAKPAFHFRAILDAIIDEANFSYTVSPKAEEKLNRLLIAPVGKRPLANSDELALTRNISSTAGNGWNYLSTPISTQGSGYPYARKEVKFEIEQEAPLFSLTDQSIFIPSFTGMHDLTVDLDCTLHLPIPSGLYNNAHETNYHSGDIGFIDVQLWDVAAGTKVKQIEALPFPTSGIYFPHTEGWNCSASTQVELVAGKQYQVRTEIVNSARYHYPVIGAYLNLFIPFQFTVNSGDFKIQPSNGYAVSEGMRVNVADWIPKISCESLLSDFITLFNLQMVPDPESPKVLHFVAHDELPQEEEIILTDEIDMDGEIIIEHLTEVASSSIRFDYKDPIDSDDYNTQWRENHRGENYGGESFSFATNMFNQPATVALKNFTAAPLTSDASGRWTAGVLSRSIDKDLKLLVVGRTEVPTTWPIAFFDASARTHGIHVATAYTPMVHVADITNQSPEVNFDINFGRVDRIMSNTGVQLPANTLVESHYKRQLEQLRDGRLYTVWARLSLAQVQALTTKVGASIWSEQLQKWFSLYALIDFDPTQAHHSLTKMKLLEITNRGGSTETSFMYQSHPSTFSITGLDYVRNASATASAGGAAPSSNIYNITQVLGGGAFLPTSGGTGGPYFFNGLTTVNESLYVAQEISATTFYSGSTNLQDLFGGGDLHQTLERGNVSNGLNVILSSSTLVAGVAHTFNDASGSASILGGGTNYLDSAPSSLILGGNNGQIQSETGSAIIGGETNYISNGYYNMIGASIYGSIQSNASAAIAAQGPQILGGSSNAILASNQGLIQNNSTLSGIFGGWIGTIDGADMSAIVGGYSGRVTHDRSVIIGGMNLVSDATDTVYTPDLKVKGRIFSGNTDLSFLLGGTGGGTPTYVQPGSNITTGGTASSPTVNVVASPSFTNVTATNFISGATNLSSVFAPISVVPTYVQNGSNTYTGGTPSRPIVNVSNTPVFSSVSADYLTANNDINYQSTTLSQIFSQIGNALTTGTTHIQAGTNIVTGGTALNPIVSVSNTPVFSTVSSTGGSFNSLTIASSFSPVYISPKAVAFIETDSGRLSGHTGIATMDVPSQTLWAKNLSGTTLYENGLAIGARYAAISVVPTYVQNGTNTTTGGTPSAPIVNVVANPTFTSVSATTFAEGGILLSSLYAPRNYTVNTKGAGHTLALADNTTFLNFTGGSTQVLTVPANGTIPFPIGSQFLVFQAGTGQVQFSGAAGVSITSVSSYMRTSTQGAAASLIKTGTNNFALIGNLSA